MPGMDLDATIFRAINDGLSCGALTAVTPFVSELGAYAIIVIIIAILAKSDRSPWRTAIAVAASAILASALCYALKKLVHAPRPSDLLPDVHLITTLGAGVLHTRSWPSGHTTLAFALVVPFVLARPRTVPLLIFPGMVAFSRIYVGAHFPSDVIAGALLGTLSGVLARSAIDAPKPIEIAAPAPVAAPAEEPK
jgi:undecaprenyl-diphosphatase